MPAKSLRREMRHGDVEKPREKFSPISVTFTNIFKVQKKRDGDVNDRHLLLLRSALQPRNLIGLSSMLYKVEDLDSHLLQHKAQTLIFGNMGCSSQFFVSPHG